MAQMTVIYKTPKDIAAFERHYASVHIPLAKQLPGLKKYERSYDPVFSTTGHSDTYLVANLYFDTMDDLRNAFASEVGRQCAADRRILAPGDGDVQIYLYEPREA